MLIGLGQDTGPKKGQLEKTSLWSLTSFQATGQRNSCLPLHWVQWYGKPEVVMEPQEEPGNEDITKKAKLRNAEILRNVQILRLDGIVWAAGSSLVQGQTMLPLPGGVQMSAFLCFNYHFFSKSLSWDGWVFFFFFFSFFSVSHLVMHPNPSLCQKEENRFTFSQTWPSSLKVHRCASRHAQEKLRAIFFFFNVKPNGRNKPHCFGGEVR